jgi:hypothetical protein
MVSLDFPGRPVLPRYCKAGLREMVSDDCVGTI